MNPAHWSVCRGNRSVIFAGVWSSVYSRGTEKTIKSNQLLTTIPLLAKEWKLSFKLKVNDFGSGWRQVLHMSIGGKGVGKSVKYGDRTPAIWTHPERGFIISSAVQGDPNFDTKSTKGELPSTGEWINIEIGQALESRRRVVSKCRRRGREVCTRNPKAPKLENVMLFTYFINKNGRGVVSTGNPEASRFENVMVFSSSPWYSPVNGSIKNLVIENRIHKYLDKRALYKGYYRVT